MKLYTRLLLTFSLVCSCAILSFGQELIFIPNLDPIGLKKDFQFSVTHLLKTYIEDTKRYRVIIPLRNDSNAITANQEERAIEYAKSVNAKYYLLGTLTRLGETVIVRISLYETASTNVIWSDRLKASSPEDLDPIMQRIATNLGTPNTVSANQDINSVTKFESNDLKKENSPYFFGGGIGLFVPFNQITNEPASGLGGTWSYDAQNIILDINGSYYFNQTIEIYWLAFDVLYPFNNTNKSFFAKGGLALGGTTADRIQTSVNYNYNYSVPNSSGGILLNAGVGYLFNRKATAQLRFSGNLIHGFYKANDRTTTGIVFKLEFLFK